MTDTASCASSADGSTGGNPFDLAVGGDDVPKHIWTACKLLGNTTLKHLFQQGTPFEGKETLQLMANDAGYAKRTMEEIARTKDLGKLERCRLAVGHMQGIKEETRLVIEAAKIFQLGFDNLDYIETLCEWASGQIDGTGQITVNTFRGRVAEIDASNDSHVVQREKLGIDNTDKIYATTDSAIFDVVLQHWKSNNVHKNEDHIEAVNRYMDEGAFHRNTLRIKFGLANARYNLATKQALTCFMLGFDLEDIKLSAGASADEKFEPRVNVNENPWSSTYKFVDLFSAVAH